MEELDVEELQEVLNGADPEATLRREVEAGIEPLMRSYATRALLVALVAGALVGALVPGRRLLFVAIGAVTGVVAVTALLLGTWRDFEPEAFDEPEFEGALERAPQIIDAVERHVDDLPAIRGSRRRTQRPDLAAVCRRNRTTGTGRNRDRAHPARQ